MPIYTYECTEKGHEFTDMCSVTDRKKDKACTQCGGVGMYKPTFKASFQYSEKYNTFAADRHKWNLRENKRLNTKGKSYA